MLLPLQLINDLDPHIQLFDPNGELVADGTKLADGRNEQITFLASISGQYKIVIYNQSKEGGEFYLSVGTKSAAKGVIAGRVFLDTNGDGTKDPVEPYLDGWTINLYDVGGNLVASQLSHDANANDPNEPAGASGLFEFEGLPKGSYTVQEVAPAGWFVSLPGPSATYAVALGLNGNRTGLKFGDFQAASIAGSFYNDLHGLGVKVPGDPVLAGWTVDLYQNGALVGAATTDDSGNYSFGNLGPGRYSIEYITPSGWIVTSPVNPTIYSFKVSSGRNSTGFDYGFFSLVTIGGLVYNDLSGNGVLDPGDPGLAGWRVELLDVNGHVVTTRKTSSVGGAFKFGPLGPGLYTVREIPLAGWTQTTPSTPGTITVAAESGVNPTLGFGNFNLVSISGSVFNDLNANGTRDKTDSGLSNWNVELFDTSGNMVASTTTNSAGSYFFPNVQAGTFTIAEVVQTNWVQTAPKPTASYTFTTSSGKNVGGVNFGDHFSTPPPAPTLFIGAAAIPGRPSTGTGSTGLSAPASAKTIDFKAVVQLRTIRVVYNVGSTNGDGAVPFDDSLSLASLDKQEAQEEAIGWIAQTVARQKKPTTTSSA